MPLRKSNPNQVHRKQKEHPKIMNEEIKQIVEQAIAPLKTEIAELKAQLAPLLAIIPKPQELPTPVKEAQQILKSIPVDVMKTLKIVNAGFDPKMVWFQLLRENGSTISIKKNGTDFRVRVRQNGELMKEMTPPLNGLVGVLKSLA